VSRDWTRDEVEAIVTDYLAMLSHHMRGERFSKTEHRRMLAQLLDRRNDSSIEYKHRNISAVLEEVGYPFLSGYKPLSNYQGLLADVVLERLALDRELERLVATDADSAVIPPLPSFEDLVGAMVAPPTPDRTRRRVREDARNQYRLRIIPAGKNYLEQEARNRVLGAAGEEFVVRFEQARLVRLGREHLAAKVEHSSRVRGDGLGYDVLSFEGDGRERLIEVKTTKHSKETPFFVSANEVAVSAEHADMYHLFRLFDFRKRPRLFSLPGALQESCELSPVGYRARVT